MKRFFVLTLVLLASSAIRGEDPEPLDLPRPMVPKRVAVKVLHKALAGELISFRKVYPPKIEVDREKTVLPVTIISPSGVPVKGIKYVKRVHREVYKQKELVVLKSKLSDTKKKLMELRKRILRAPQAQRRLLIKEKRVFRRECRALKDKIRVVKERLKETRKVYMETKMKKLEKKSTKVKQCLDLLRPKLRELTAKLQTTRDTMKIAPLRTKSMLVAKLKKLEHMIAKVKVDLGAKLSKQKDIIKAIIKFKMKIIKTVILKVQKKLYVTKTKISKVRDKIVAIRFKVDVLEKRLLKMVVNTPKQRVKAEAIKHKIEVAKARVTKLTVVVKNLKIVAKGIKKEITFQTSKLRSIKKVSRCAELTKKLAKQLKKAKRLKAIFDKECKQAVGTKTPKDVIHAIKISKKIKDAQAKISVIKRMIVSSNTGKRGRQLTMKKFYIEKLKAKKAEVKKLQVTLKVIKVKCSKAIGVEKKELERQKVELLNKIAGFKKEIIDLQRKAVLLKVSITKNCRLAIIKEKARSKELMDDAAKKLRLARSEAFKLAQALELAKKAARLEAQAHKLKVLMLETTNKKDAAELATKRGKLLAKAAEYRNLVKKHQLRARMIRKTLELRSAKELAHAKKVAEMKEKLYAEKIKESVEKSEALRKAMEAATEEAVKEALREQHDLEVKRLNKYNAKLKMAQDSLKAATIEIELKKKALVELKKEATLKAIMYQKHLKAKFGKMRVAFDIKKKHKIGNAVITQTGVENAHILKLKQRIKVIQSEFKAFKLALHKAHVEKTAKLLASQKAEFEAILTRLKKKLVQAHKEYEEYKMEFEKESNLKLKAIIKESKEATKGKIAAIEVKIKNVKAEGKARLQAVRKSYQEQLNIRRKEADKQIASIRARIKTFTASTLRKEAEIERETSVETSKATELKVEISSEKKKQAEDSKEYDGWEKQQKKNLKAVLKSKKAATDKQLATLKSKADKAKAKALHVKATLNVKLKAAIAEIAQYQASLKKESTRYHGLVREFDQYKIKAERKYVKGLTTEKAKRVKLEEDMNVKLADCSKMVLKSKKKAIELNEDITQKFEEISHWNEEEKKRSEAKVKIVSYRDKLLKLQSTVASTKSSYEETCSDDKDRAECVAMKTTIGEAEASIAESATKLEEERKIYLA